MITRHRLSAVLLSLLIFIAHIPDVSALSSSLDTDGDGLSDAVEDVNGSNVMDAGETNPWNADTDGGGESDGAEVAEKRNPLDPTDDLTYDADGDGWANGIEAEEKTDPQNKDTDGDGITDPLDAFPLDSRYFIDTNSNKLPDEWEKIMGLSDAQGTPTRVDDPDGDGLTNAEEFARGTNPLETDTDRDGIDDKTEWVEGTDPKENACLIYGPATSGFADMREHWAFDIVSHMSRILILPDSIPLIRGYERAQGLPVHFNPDASMTRYDFLKLVMLSTCTKLHSRSEIENIRFSDVRQDAPINESSETAFKRKIIYSAVHYGIVSGYEDNTFRADALISRSEVLKILNLAAGLSEFAGADHFVFTDVQDSDWFASYVKIAFSREIIKGYPDGTFRPHHPVTRAEAAKIIYLTMRGNPVINGYVLPTEGTE